MDERTRPRVLVPAVVLFLFCLSLGSVTAKSLSSAAKAELRFLTWSEYMDPLLLDEFERRFNAKLTEVYFESDDMRDDMLVETDGKGYDVILVSGIVLDAYRRRGWLAPLGDTEVPNLRHVAARWLDLFPEARGYAVPFFWGTTGIGYRKDLVQGAIDSWMQLYRPAEALRGRIYMAKQGRDVVGMALKALGHSANSSDDEDLDEAEELVLAQKPYVKAYSYPSLNANSGLVTGAIHAAMMFNGDVLVAQQHQPAITYVVPREGGNLWVDYLVVTQSSERKQLAYQFIDFLNEPPIAARLARFVHYASPNKGAEALLPPEFLGDPIIYPTPEVLKRCEVYTRLPPQATRRRNTIFARLLQ